MSTSDRVLEPGSGRCYVGRADENGRIIRRSSNDVYSGTSKSESPRQTSSNHRATTFPESRDSSTISSRREDFGYEDSTEDIPILAGSLQHTSVDFVQRREAGTHDSRGSESASRRPDDIPEYEERRDPIFKHYASSSKICHSSAGYNQPPRDGYSAADRHSTATTSSGFEATSSHHFSNTYNEPPAHHWAGRSEDTGLVPGMTGLNIGNTNTDFTYRKEHASLPTTTYLDNRTQAQWPSTISPHPDFYSGSYQDKGKGVELTQPGTETPPPAEPHYIAGTKGDREFLDKSYKVRGHDYKKWFRVGRVFSTLWTDALGSATNEYDSQFMSTVSIVQYGEKVYSTIRRFVVVKCDKGANACVCLPVTTYNGRGIGRRGIRLDHHGQIYSGDRPPERLNGINKQPLRVRLCTGAQRLDRRSCINYGNPYTIQTNVKVKDVGELDSDSGRLLIKYYNEVNIATYEDEYSDPGLPRTAADKAAELTGMGGAVSDTFGSYSGANPPVFWSASHFAGSPDTYHSSSQVQHGTRWTGSSEFVPAGQSSFVADAGYSSHTGPSPQVVSSSVNYSKSPGYDRNHPSTSDRKLEDDRYIDSNSAVAGGGSNVSYWEGHDTTYANSQYSSTPVASSSAWPISGSFSTHQDQSYLDEEVVVLPTLKEAEASRTSRRYITSQNGGNGRSQARGKDRDRDRE